MTARVVLAVEPRRIDLCGGRALRPISLTDYSITGGFWARFQERNRDAIIPHCEMSLERVGWIENFRAACRGTLAVDRRGPLFADSEIYKTIEAIAWENARRPSPEMAKRIAQLTDLLADAQHADGYLHTYYGYEGGPERYSDMESGHELYCLGHLIQAGVAVLRSGGPKRFVDIARRAADHVCAEFGINGKQMIDGHPEIETALVELYRATGDDRYLDQARIFIERRGHQILADTIFGGRDYYQDNVPVRESSILVGHVVRALYLTAGAIDVAVETGDAELLGAVRAQYDRTLERRTYLTGGMGSYHHGEAFGADFELPSGQAYAETCAAVASVHVAWRLLLATGDERYADVIERTLYNGVACSPSVDGTSFFYVNTLRRHSPGTAPEPGVPSLRRTDGRRASWFTTSCCPTNLARIFASLSGYMATVDSRGIQVHQYAEGVLDTCIGGSRRVRMTIATQYPNDGAVVVRIDETDGAEWTLTLRVPAWVGAARLVCDGEEIALSPGVASVTRSWGAGDEIELQLDIRPRFVVGDSRIDDIRGCAAVERGPLVYALESVDQAGVDLDLVGLDTHEALNESTVSTGLEDVIPIAAAGIVLSLEDGGWPYRAAGPVPASQRVDLTFIPYYRWANRAPSTMRIWAPRADLARR